MIFQNKIEISVQYLKRLQIVDVVGIVKSIVGVKETVTTLYEKYEQSDLNYLVTLIVYCEKEEAFDISAQIQNAMLYNAEKTTIRVEDFFEEEAYCLA